MKSRKIGLFGKRTKTRAAATAHKKTTLRRGLVETLEKRELLAADFGYASGPIGFYANAAGYQLAQERIAQEAGSSGSGATSAVAEGGVNDVVNMAEVEPNQGFYNPQVIPLNNNFGVNISGTSSGILDEDWYAFDLKAGDIIDVKLNSNIGSIINQPMLSLYNSSNREMVSSLVVPTTDANSPLTGGNSNLGILGDLALHYAIPTDGTYRLRVSDVGSSYTIQARKYRSVLEAAPADQKQILYLDFDGAIVSRNYFDGVPGIPTTGSARLSPISTYLTGYGLEATDEALFIDEIVQRVQQKFDTLGENTTNPNFGIEIRNSKDHPDPWGQLNVSRVIIGGTFQEAANDPAAANDIGLLGIAQSVDFGNFDTEETAIVMNDVLLSSFATLPISSAVPRVESIAELMAFVVTHEAGHFLGGWHQDPNNATLSIMDQFYDPIVSSGAGVDGIFGTADDRPIEFASDGYAAGGQPFEPGAINDVVSSIGWGLTTGQQGGRINGRVYQDNNLSRSIDTGDTFLGGIQVFADLNGNGVLNTGEYSTTSDSSGNYSLLVPPGSYTIREVVPAAYRLTAPVSNSVSVTVALNQTVNNINFGQELLNQNFTGMKWNDANANKLRDPGEVGIGGVFIYIDLDNDNRIDIGEPQTQTAADGSYKLKFPGPGTYSIREVAAGGYVQTYPGAAFDNEHVVTITGDPAIDATRILGLNFGNSLTVDFGDAPASYGAASAGFDPGLRLGANWDAEASSLFSDNAQGDDTNGSDDEDGVALARPLVRGSTGNRLVVTANNTTGAPAYVNAWIDYNKNGVFSSDERVITSQLVATGTSNITFAASNSALLGNTFARVIYSSEASPGPNASVSRGEVEDYVVNVVDAFEVAVDDSDSVARNSVLNEIDVLANDFQLPGDGLEIVSVSSTSADGTATISSNQTILYTPRSGFIGQDVFTYTVRNAVGDTDTATVVVNVTLSFDNPEAVDDSYDVAVNAIDLPLNVIANDIEGQNGALNILSVTQPDKGGKITIATGNKSLRYTPLRSFGGTETFRYTVSDGSGNQSSATVTLHTLPGDRADDDLEIKLVARDLNGQLITAIPQGEKFVIDFVVDDLRHDSTNPGTAAGVFAAYADILYNLQLVSTVNPTVTNSRLNFEASFFNNYNDGQNGDATIPGIIEEFGAFFSLSSMAEPGPVKVASITFEARSPGIATFFPDPADVSPTSDSLLFDTSSTPVPVERIRYLGTSLEVVGDGALFPVAVDDSLVNTIPAGAIQVPIDVLKNDLPGSVGNLSIADFDTNTINGGLVKLNTAGNGLLYTPRSNFNGTDQFQYTITDSRGIQSVATVTLRVGTQNPIVGLDLSVTDLSGAPIDQITVGSQFQLRGYVQDLRSAGSSLGVFAAYEDILYSSTLVSVVDSSTNDPNLGFQVQFGSNYQRVREGDIRTTGLINELGAVSTGDIPLGTGRELLFTVTMTANATGTASFVADPADIKPLHDTLTYNPVEALDVGQIRFGSDTLQILSSTGGGGGEGYYNAQNPLDVNDDGFVSPIDALSIINRLNSGDTDLGAVAGEGEVSKRLYVDTNNDGFLAPIDALLVINRLNANSLAAQAEGEGTQEVDLLAPAAGSLATSAPGLEGGSVVSTNEELGLAITAGDSSSSSSNSGNSASQNAFLAATDGIFDDSDASEEGFLSALAADVEDIWKKRSLA